jgi:hypothetical protein
MTKNTRQTSTAKKGKGALKVGKLVLNKETVRDLTSTETKKVKGGQKMTVNNPSSHSCGGTCGTT